MTEPAKSPNGEESISPRDRKVYLVCICLGLVIALVATGREWQILHDFSRDTASLARGTGIRPLGVTFYLFIAEVGGLLLGTICMIPAVVIGWRSRRRQRVALALLICALCAIPISVGQSAFMHIVNARGLVLEE